MASICFHLFSAVHEKIFIVFMVASIAHMVFATAAFKWSKHRGMTEDVSSITVIASQN